MSNYELFVCEQEQSALLLFGDCLFLRSMQMSLSEKFNARRWPSRGKKIEPWMRINWIWWLVRVGSAIVVRKLALSIAVRADYNHQIQFLVLKSTLWAQSIQSIEPLAPQSTRHKVSRSIESCFPRSKIDFYHLKLDLASEWIPDLVFQQEWN